MIITDEFDIPPYVWLSSILAYRDRFYPGAASLETHLLIDAILAQDDYSAKEEGIRQTLDKLHALGLITVETRLGLDQWLSVMLHGFRQLHSILRRANEFCQISRTANA